MTVADVLAYAESCLAPSPDGRCGLEIETLVVRPGDPAARPGPRELPDPEPLPAGSRVTLEPGGQVELSTRPCDDVDTALDVAAADEAVLAERLAARGLAARPGAWDDVRPPARVLDLPRYRAMEAFFDATGPEGRAMMCGTASLQVNVGNGPDPGLRWRVLHRLAPVLAATFAASPGRDRHGVWWASRRLGTWAAIDPGRTAAPALDRDPVAAWADYLLAADVMLVRSGTQVRPLRPGLPFARWLDQGHEAGWPSPEDLRYHASTLFPPVRPRGWLELRVLDAVPRDVREVALLVLAAALHPEAAAVLGARLPDPAYGWVPAARSGLGDPDLAASADLLFDVATAHLSQVTARPERVAAVECYRETHVRARRQPGQPAPTAAARAR